MDFFVKRIWWITIPTALVVLAFQLYWLRTAYLSQQASFVQVASDALQKAYDKSIITSVKKLDKEKLLTDSLPEGQKENSSFVKVIARDDSSQQQHTIYEKNFDLQAAGGDMSRFLATILAFSNVVPTDTALLSSYYREELHNRQIRLPFRLSVLHKDTLLPPAHNIISIRSISPQAKQTIMAQFEGTGAFLLLKILWPLVLSFFMIMLITGCIWVLWRIIIRQKKLETMKNDFISNITHELKTPVAILTATNEALLTFGGMHDAEKTARYLKLEQDELHKLQGLVDNIMALTRLEHEENPLSTTEMISVPALLKAVVSRFSGLPGVHIHTDIQVDKEQLPTQPAALKTILTNLLDNAIKYTATPDKQIQVVVREDKTHYRFAVTDNGIGIDKLYQPYIFDKFYRVSQGNIHEVKGYGLGLSHVKSLLQKMGGNIYVESRPGTGSTFTIELAKR